MRVLKFRAWDKTNHRMLDRVLAGPGDPCSLVWDDTRREWVQFDDACGVLMQYTGLKDCNGKDIYEGDIVRIEHTAMLISPGTIGVVSYSCSCGCYVIDTKEHTHGLGLYLFFDRRYKRHANPVIEVVGNVWEHPELAPKKK